MIEDLVPNDDWLKRRTSRLLGIPRALVTQKYGDISFFEPLVIESGMFQTSS